MWAGHFLFHLSVGWGSAWTVIGRFMHNAHWNPTDAAGYAAPSSLLGADAVRVAQTLLLDAGLLLALYLAWRIARAYAPRSRDALRLFAPWAGLATVLFAAGVWIVLQPMEMRGVTNSFALT